MTYGDMLSLLVVFFVLIFSLAHPGRRKDTTRHALAAGALPQAIPGARLNRHSDISHRWRLVEALRFPGDALDLDVAQTRLLYRDVVPPLRGSASSILVVSHGTPGDERDGASRSWQRALVVRDELVRAGIDKNRIKPFRHAHGEPPRGLANGQLEAVRHATGPIVVIYAAAAAVPRLP